MKPIYVQLFLAFFTALFADQHVGTSLFSRSVFQFELLIAGSRIKSNVRK